MKHLLFPQRTVNRGVEGPSPDERYSQAEQLKKAAERDLPAFISDITIEFGEDDTLDRLVAGAYREKAAASISEAIKYAQTVRAKIAQAAKDQGIKGFNPHFFNAGDTLKFSENGTKLTVSYGELNTKFDLLLGEHTGDQVPELRQAIEGSRLESLAKTCRTGVVYSVADVLGYDWGNSDEKEEFIGKVKGLGLTDEKIQELAPSYTGSRQLNSAICKFLLEEVAGENALNIFEQLKRGAELDADWVGPGKDAGAGAEELKPAEVERAPAEPLTVGGATGTGKGNLAVAEMERKEREEAEAKAARRREREGEGATAEEAVQVAPPVREEKPAEGVEAEEAVQVAPPVREEKPAEGVEAEEAVQVAPPVREEKPAEGVEAEEAPVVEGGLAAGDIIIEEGPLEEEKLSTEEQPQEPEEPAQRAKSLETAAEEIPEEETSAVVDVVSKGGFEALDLLSEEDYKKYLEARWEIAMDEARETLARTIPDAVLVYRDADDSGVNKRVEIQWEGFTVPVDVQAISLSGERIFDFIDADGKDKEKEAARIRTVLDAMGLPESAGPEALTKARGVSNLYSGEHYTRPRGAVEAATLDMMKTYSPALEAFKGEDVNDDGEVRTLESLSGNEYKELYLPYLWRKQIEIVQANLDVINQKVSDANVEVSFEENINKNKEFTLKRGDQEVVITFAHPPGGRINRFDKKANVAIRIEGRPNIYPSATHAMADALKQLGVTEIAEGAETKEPVADALGVAWNDSLDVARAAFPDVTIEEDTRVDEKKAKRGFRTVTLELEGKKATVTVAPKGPGKVKGLEDDKSANFRCLQTPGVDYPSFQEAVNGADAWLRAAEAVEEVPAVTPAKAGGADRSVEAFIDTFGGEEAAEEAAPVAPAEEAPKAAGADRSVEAFIDTFGDEGSRGEAAAETEVEAEAPSTWEQTLAAAQAAAPEGVTLEKRPASDPDKPVVAVKVGDEIATVKKTDEGWECLQISDTTYPDLEKAVEGAAGHLSGEEPAPAAPAAPAEAAPEKTPEDLWNDALETAKASLGTDIAVEEQPVSGRPARRGARTLVLSLGEKKATVTVSPKGFFGKVKGFDDNSTASFDCVQAKGDYGSFQEAIDGAAAFLKPEEAPAPEPTPAEEPKEEEPEEGGETPTESLFSFEAAATPESTEAETAPIPEYMPNVFPAGLDASNTTETPGGPQIVFNKPFTVGDNITVKFEGYDSPNGPVYERLTVMGGGETIDANTAMDQILSPDWQESVEDPEARSKIEGLAKAVYVQQEVLSKVNEVNEFVHQPDSKFDDAYDYSQERTLLDKMINNYQQQIRDLAGGRDILK